MAAKLSGGGGGKFDLGQNSDINVTPFVDVMLVLLIIFMVAAPLATVSIKVDIPPAIPSPIQNPKKPTFIAIQPGGVVYLGQNIVPLEQLAAALDVAIGGAEPRKEQVMVQADRNVAYKDFMKIMNTLQMSGYQKIGLVAEDL